MYIVHTNNLDEISCYSNTKILEIKEIYERSCNNGSVLSSSLRLYTQIDNGAKYLELQDNWPLQPRVKNRSTVIACRGSMHECIKHMRSLSASSGKRRCYSGATITKMVTKT